MPNTRNPRARQAKSITGRDGCIELLALAFAIAAIELRLPEKYQEWSKDMRLLLDHFCPSKVDQQQLLDGARAHLTGIGWGQTNPPGNVVSLFGVNPTTA